MVAAPALPSLDPLAQAAQLLEHELVILGRLALDGSIKIHVNAGVPCTVSPDHPRDRRYRRGPSSDYALTSRQTLVLGEVAYHLAALGRTAASGAVIIQLVRGVPQLPLRLRLKLPLDRKATVVQVQARLARLQPLLAGGTCQGSVTVYVTDGRATEIGLESTISRATAWIGTEPPGKPATGGGLPGWSDLARALDDMAADGESGSVTLEIADGQPLLPLTLHGQIRIIAPATLPRRSPPRAAVAAAPLGA